MSLTPKVFSSPATIWLVYGDLDHDDKHSNFPEVTWCEDSQFDSDVRYVRADLTEIEQLKAENERLRAELELRKGEWEDYTERLQDALSSQTADNTRLKSLLTDWQEFATDVSAADCGGQDWLNGLRGRTKTALEQKA